MTSDDKVETDTRELIVTSSFTLRKDDGETISYGVGTYPDVSRDVADHWYVRAHSLPEGQRTPSPGTAASPVDESERNARAVAEEENQRLRVISQRATDDLSAARVETEQMRQQLETVETERDALRQQLETVETERAALKEQLDNLGEDEEPTTDDVHVRRKGRKFFVYKKDELVGEFPNREAADAKAAELRASPSA